MIALISLSLCKGLSTKSTNIYCHFFESGGTWPLVQRALSLGRCGELLSTCFLILIQRSMRIVGRCRNLGEQAMDEAVIFTEAYPFEIDKQETTTVIAGTEIHRHRMRRPPCLQFRVGLKDAGPMV